MSIGSISSIPSISLFWLMGTSLNPAHAQTPIPVHGLHFSCTDPKFPAVLEEYILGCGPDGEVDRMMSIHDKTVTLLPEKGNWGIGTVLFRLGRPGGIWDPNQEMWSGDRVLRDVGAVITQQDVVAVTTQSEVIVRRRDQRIQHRQEAKPVGWHPPAVTSTYVAWIEWNTTGQKIAIWEWENGGEIQEIPVNHPLF